MRREKIEKFIVVASILLIIVLATFFHFEIHFENALTNIPDANFGVRISIWRYIFEPVLGILLFFNRSIYPLKELPFALIWIIILYLLFGVIQAYKKRDGSKNVLIKKLSNIPLLLGICFSIFVLILFIPLPNNTIVNHSKNSILVTTHAHTEYSHDGLISQEAMWRWHKRNGFDAFFISDHANHKKTLQFSQAQRNGEFEIAPLIMVGQEHSGTNHMSLLGLNGKFDTKGMSDKAVIDSVHQYGGAVIINHWFDGKGKEKEFYHDLGVDGFEVENVGSDLYYDREIFEELKKFCRANNLTMIGGLDFHGYGRACSIYNALEIPNWKSIKPNEKERAILEIFKNGQQDKIKVLIYKDRDFYSDTNLIFRPFLTLINYFRTLNFIQVISWVIWILLFQFSKKRINKNHFNSDKMIVVIAGFCVVFLLSLSVVYYFNGEAVKGYSKVYSEYFSMLGIIGVILAIFVFLLTYLRFFKTSISNHNR
ncbi:PHP domain-containing protein [uncultured Maribacter sp.]|uniref:PHP domain-containing protein n=1 Tax=uncultured Maribacter sp. TaxID=431308 RepID=UPI0030EB7A1B|tara:strand:+ start:66405 stop:67850 length:1446 start_codon:yes stop_codon:yes gene_type:complete